MSEMVERVARAIHLAQGQWEQAESPPLALVETLARAAIEATREPTEAMARACLVLLWSKAGIGEETPAELWQAMIDEAMK